MINSKATGILLAATAAALFSTASVNAAEMNTAADQVKCSGVNACKGMSECATATNACKGHNSCKGTGWLHMTKADCDAKGGTVMMEEKK